MTHSIEESLRMQLHAAFDGVEVPAGEVMLQPVYAGNDDGFMMRKAFEGKRWNDLPIDVVSYHRESLFMLSGVGYRAYLPAYLSACLANDKTYGPDIREYTLYGLTPHSKSEAHLAAARERLSLLDHAQRKVIADILRYLADTWHMRDADAVLRSWE